MPQLPHYLFSWEREGNPYTSNPINFKILQSVLSDQPLQRTSLDLQCVCDPPQNCPILQNFMYILHEFHTFPVTEGNEILHLHFSSQLLRTHPKIHEKYEFPAFPHPKSHEFLRPLNDL